MRFASFKTFNGSCGKQNDFPEASVFLSLDL